MSAAQSQSLIRRLLRQARPYWPHLGCILLFDLIAMPLALLLPLPLKIVVDSVLGSEPLPGFLAGFAFGDSAGAALTLAVALVVVIAALGQVQRFATWMLQTYTGEKMVLDFRAGLFRHVQRLSLAYHDRQGTADSIYRIQYDAPAIQWLAVYGIAPFITAGFTLLGMIVVTARLDGSLAFVALAVVPPLLLLSHYFGVRLRARWHAVKKLESSSASVLQEALTSLRVVKAFVQESREQSRFVDRASREVHANLRVVRLQSVFFALVAMILAIGTAAALYLGASHVQSGLLTLGELLIVMTYLAQLYGPLETLTNKLTELQGSFASAERAFALLDELPEVVERPNARALQRAHGDIEFRNIGFAYGGGNTVLQNVSFQVPAGARAGVMGRTGAGKTTIANLLARFFDPSEGSILLDGVDLRDYRLDDLRRQFAIVLQETTLFSASLAENIAYGRPDASFEEIVEAARAAHVHDFIMGLAQGYETQVGERGMLLSGGERQRIALARAFLKDAPILILDEPTSAVDPRTEASIMQAMETLMHGRTTVMIAHRLSTLAGCDLLLRFEGERLTVTRDVPGALEGAGSWQPAVVRR